MARDTYKYHIKVGNKIVHTGITNDLHRRGREHQRDFGERSHIVQVGRAVSRESALEWEREQRAQGKPTGP